MQFNNIHMSELMPAVSAHGQQGGPKYAEKATSQRELYCTVKERVHRLYESWGGEKLIFVAVIWALIIFMFAFY